MRDLWAKAWTGLALTFCLQTTGAGGQDALAGESIAFTCVPARGSFDDLTGTVAGVVPADHKVAVYIYVEGWWTKPTFAQPLTPIATDSNWVCDITTGEGDQNATEIAAFLVTNGYSPPALSGHATLPDELYVDSLANVHTNRAPHSRTIVFSGMEWTVKASASPVGPGPNPFTDSEDDVWVDEDGELHLRISYTNGRWVCTEVVATESLGYGTYVFAIRSGVTNLDRNVVGGFFTWHTAAPEYNYREIDIEISRWGDPAAANAQYVVQPWDTPGNRSRFDITQDRPTTHSFCWSSDSISFRSNYGFTRTPPPEDVITNWVYTGADIPPPGGENPRINFWLMGGLPPANGQGAEIVIREFRFVPSVSAIGPLIIAPGIQVGWNSVSGALYQAQWTPDLRSNGWNDLDRAVEGTGGLQTVWDTTPGRTTACYRMVLAE